MSFDPTPAMTERCEAWLKVVDTLEKYLNAASVRYDWISEATSRLSREMPQPEDLGEQFAPIGKGGIKDVFVKLWWDLNLPDGKAAESASAIIKNELLQEVESLKADLQHSISDFSDHSASFDESLAPSKTASLRDPQLQSKIEQYQKAVALAEAGKQPEMDPYLLKVNLDRRIEHILRKHNSQADAYAYVQDAAKKVDGEVTRRLQSILKSYTDIVERNGNIIVGGGRSVKSVFINQPQLFEYKHWLQSNKAPSTFVGSRAEAAKQREDGDLGYENEDSVYAKAIRAGTLERRSKILRTYSPGEYVLTPLSLIEMRMNKPVWSIDLKGARMLEDDKDKDRTGNQFVLEARQHGSSSGKLHKFVFRARVAANWKRDLSLICAGEIPPSLEDVARQQNQAQGAGKRSDLADAPVAAAPVAAAPVAAAPVAAVPVAQEPAVAEPVVAISPPLPVGTASIASEPSGAAPVSQSAVADPAQPLSLQSQHAATAGAVPAVAGLSLNKPSDPVSGDAVAGDAVAAQGLHQKSPFLPSDAAPITPSGEHSAPAPFSHPQFESPPVAAATEPLSEQSSLVGSDRAAVGVSPPSKVASPQLTTHSAAGIPPISAAVGPAAAGVGADAAGHAAHDISDSDVSDVDQGFDQLSDEEEFKDTLAYKAQQDMAVFQAPTGSTLTGSAQPGLAEPESASASGKDPRFVADTGNNDDVSVWSYDAKNKDEGNTFKNDSAFFEPVEATIPVEQERQLSNTAHKYEKPHLTTTTTDMQDPEEPSEDVVRRRRSSVGGSDLKRRGSRKATGSFGGGDGDLKPLSQLSQEDKNAATQQPTLFFTEQLPETTGSKPSL